MNTQITKGSEDATHSVEDELQPVPESARTTKLSGQFWIWAGANVAPINWFLGALGIYWGLSLADTMTVIVIGNMIGMAGFGFFVLLGQKTGATGMLLARGAFGRKGAYLPAGIQAVVAVGWSAINTWIVLSLVMSLFGLIGWVDPKADNILWKIIVAAIIMGIQVAITFRGYGAISKFERWTMPPTVVVLLAMTIVAWTTLPVDWSYAGEPGNILTGSDRIAAMSGIMTAIGIGWGIGWFTYAPDYSRFVSKTIKPSKLWLTSALGMFLPVVWLGLLGASLATMNQGDPGELVVKSFGVLAIPVILLVIHGPIATNIINLYTFGVAFQALDIKIGRKKLSVMVGILSLLAVIALIFAKDFGMVIDAWLVAIASWVATWAGIMVVHYFIFERRQKNFGYLFLSPQDTRLKAVNWSAIVAFFAGLVMTWEFMNGGKPPFQGSISMAMDGIDLSWLAGFLTSGVLYFLFNVSRFTQRRHHGVPLLCAESDEAYLADNPDVESERVPETAAK